MIPQSIRWRLPLSYAAIALLAALALGLVLITTLRGYYQQRELGFLNANAAEFSQVAGRLLSNGVSTDTLQRITESFSFLSQARVRLIDVDDQPLADSGVPERTDVAFGAAWRTPISDTTFVGTVGNVPPDVITFMNVGEDALPVPDGAISFTQFVSPSFGLSFGVGPGITSTPPLSLIGTPLGFTVATEAPAANARSDQHVRQPIQDEAGALLGYLEMSDGPAYGREIVDSVTAGWAMSGGIAVLLAASVGWFASRRISLPLMALNKVTTRMAHGDLSSRADVTHRDEFGTLARSFNEMADQVEATVVTLRQFVGDAAHELHTPLTALRTDLELAADSPAPTDRQSFLTRAQEQVGRLATLTSGLLDLSRIEAGQPQPLQQPIDLNDLTRQTSEPYASYAEQRGVAFSLDTPEGEVVVRGDAGQLRRAFGNLLDNAIKFTPEGGMVRVGLRRVADRAKWEVSDTGIGVPGDDLPQLFSRFHRGRNAAPYPGNGLGLAIVKAVVEQHGGTVTAENLSPGAHFVIWLPLGNGRA